MESENSSRKGGSALVIILSFVTLIAIVVVSLLLLSKFERTTSNLALGRAQAEVLADYGMDVALARLHKAISEGLGKGKMWVSEPGRIRVFQRSDPSQYTDHDLFAALPGPDSAVRDEKNVDLNRARLDGTHPIAPPAPGKTAATMKTGWLNLPANPSIPAGAGNPIVARIAYWVDDDSCKVNINTADGSQKYTRASFGFGTPSEISLQALQDDEGVNLTQAQASAASKYAWDHGFNSVAELGRVSGISADFVKHNAFNLTFRSKAPELTFYGEPRIYLLPVNYGNVEKTRTALTGPYRPQDKTGNVFDMAVCEPIDFVYPSSRQLPKALPTGFYQYPTSQSHFLNDTLPQYPVGVNGQIVNRPQNTTSNRSANFVFLSRIARALDGKDSQNGDVEWPAFGQVGASPATKYNARQRDSIALQIIDLSNNSVFVDHARAFSHPSISTGILGNETDPKARNELAIGVGRTPKLTEVYVTADASVSDPFGTQNVVPYVQPKMMMEFYFPKYYLGVPLQAPYAGNDPYQWRTSNKTIYTKYTTVVRTEIIDEVPVVVSSTVTSVFPWSVLNEQDIRISPPGQAAANLPYEKGVPVNGEPTLIDPSSYWMDNLLRVPGVDLAGNPASTDFGGPMPDPDQNRAATNHAPYASAVFGGTSGYRGAQTSRVATRIPFGMICAPMMTSFDTWHPGVYHSQDDYTKGNVPYYGKIGTTAFTFSGGVAFRSHTAAGEYGLNWELAPLDGLRSEFYTNESPPDIKVDLMKAVIPVELTAPDSYIARVADPLVNKFPGDWEKVPGATDPTFKTPPKGNLNAGIYARGGNINDPDFPGDGTGTVLPQDVDGDNPGYKPAGGGDPLSLWMPRQDVRYPKQSRFPSIGALNYVRTGIIPDDLSVDLAEQKGVPWRSLNLSSNSSQGVYPDWAIFDLFTVPFVPQPAYYVGETPTRKRHLTFGGATEGKLNINNPRVPYPFNLNITGVSQTPPERTAPLEALFYGIRTSTSYSGSDPVYETVDKNKAAALREAVQTRLSSSGPFILPGQLAEVSAVNAYTYNGVNANATSRNDLMREVLGAITTQSNTFSIWVVAQSIKKNPKNANPDVFEPGDTIVGECRRRYVVERFIECGKDGVPGNALKPTTDIDRVVGTEDDPIDPNYHPAMTYPLPYRWKIVAVEDVNS